MTVVHGAQARGVPYCGEPYRLGTKMTTRRRRWTCQECVTKAARMDAEAKERMARELA